MTPGLPANRQSSATPYNYTQGIDYWPEHMWKLMLPIKQDVEITMGNIYTVDATGHVVAPTAASSVATCQRGAFQACFTWTNTDFPPLANRKGASADTKDGARQVQFLGHTSFIIMTAGAGVHPGLLVDVETPTAATVDLAKVKANTTKRLTNGTIGVCVDILEPTSLQTATMSENRLRKPITVDNDKIAVRLGVF